MNKAEWYRQLSVSVPLEVEKSVKLKGGSDAKFLPDTWMAFMTGWIHCTRGTYSLCVSSYVLQRSIANRQLIEVSFLKNTSDMLLFSILFASTPCVHFIKVD